MSLMNVLIIFKDGSECRISGVYSFRYHFENNSYKLIGPFFEIIECFPEDADILGAQTHLFSLDTIDFIEVY